jgi:hypothetical protein
VDEARGRLPPTEEIFYYDKKMIDRFRSTNKFII